MIVKFLLLGFCTAALAQVDQDAFETLKSLTDKGESRVWEVYGKVSDPSQEYLEMTEERVASFMGELLIQRHDLNRSVGAAAFKGLFRNNKFTNFECISNVARDTFVRLDETGQTAFKRLTPWVEAESNRTQRFSLIMPGLIQYVEGYYIQQKEEMTKAKDEAAVQKILDDTRKKMKILETVLEGIESKTRADKFKFFEEFVDFIYTTETSLRKIVREGKQKMMNCVA